MTEEGATWRVERHVGAAQRFHDRPLPLPVRRSVWWFEVDRPAVVLGSTQSPVVVDTVAAARADVEVASRRSGGGAVWLAPGTVTWVDVVLPSHDPWWVADVGKAAGWLGQAWVGALGDLGVTGAVVHRGPMVRSADSDLVCFAGVAPGEVVVEGRKVVGISQRRTRHGARFQCAVLHAWDPEPLVRVLALGDDERRSLAARLASAGAGVGPLDPAAVVAAIVARLRGAG